jgi:flagellin-like hook-associated protein FlgL
VEINDYLNNSVSSSVDALSTLSSSINVKALEKVDISKDLSNAFALEVNAGIRRSDLSISLKSMMDTISDSQISIRNLEEQSNILTRLRVTSTASLNSDTQTSLEILQPSVEQLLEKYNYLSENINKNFEKYQEETNSHNYFDGMLGAKPLNPAEIIDAVEKQAEIVRAEKKFFGDNVEKVADKALEVINIEIDKSNKEAPFKNIDFGKNTANFTSANINNVVGSVVSSQANAIPANSPKLLA